MSDKDVSYRDAIEELDAILAAIESTDVDVDELSTRVKRAQELIELCTGRIRKAHDDVEQVIARLEDEGD
jgi:exodeoxyribonuclease VII small subunit